MERPQKCYIRQEWFEAVSFMTPEDRCLFYETLMSFVYYGSQRDTLPPHVRGVFEMARPTLQKDINLYDQKVQINRQNGSNGGRPQGGQTQKNPEKPKETQKTHIYNNNIQLQLGDVSPNSAIVNVAEREKEVLVELFARGVVAPLDETHRLCDYYDARGWVDKGGNPIVSIPALARVWKAKDESPYLRNVRQKWADFLRILPGDMPKILCTDFVRYATKEDPKKGSIATIFCRSKEFVDTIEENYIPQLKIACKGWKVANLKYICENTNT